MHTDKDVTTGHAQQKREIANNRVKVKNKSRAIRNSAGSKRTMDNMQPNRDRRKTPRLSSSTCPKPPVIKPCRNQRYFRPNLRYAAAADDGVNNYCAREQAGLAVLPLSLA